MKKIKKKRGRGKPKGSAFERQICKKLSLWVTHGKREDVFWRSAMSGGRATIAAAKGKDLRRQAGDITAVAPEGHALTDKFFVETKHYTDLAIGSFFVKGKGILAKFWVKACKEAARYEKQPLMIVRQNNMPILVIVKAGTLDRVGLATILLCQPLHYDVFLFNEVMKTRFRK